MRLLFLVFAFLSLDCAAARADVAPTLTYFPILAFDAASDATPQLIPVAANQSLAGAHAGIMRAILVIHDETRDAMGAVATVASLAGAANSSVMILAPQFLLPSDLTQLADRLPDQGRAFASWQYTGWPVGNDSLATAPQKGVSSFTAVDLLLMYLSDRDVFPDLKGIIIAGSGAGADFVQRYAALNIAEPVLNKQNIAVHYTVAGATSYLYITDNRPLGGRKGFGRPDTTACPDFDVYPYGLEKLNPYAKHVGANAAKANYATRFITYLSAPPVARTETNCAVSVQGNNDAVRAENFRLYMNSLYGDAAAQTQIFAVVKSATNNAVDFFGSTCGMSSLFGDGACSSALTMGQGQ